MDALIKMKIIKEILNETDLITPKIVRITALLLLVIIEIIGAICGYAYECFLGLLLGGIIDQLLFRQQELIAEKTVRNGKKSIAVFGYIIRMAIRSAAIIISIKRNDISILATIFGILSINYSILLISFINNRIIKANDINEDEKKYIDYSSDDSWNTKDEYPGSMMREIRDEIMK